MPSIFLLLSFLLISSGAVASASDAVVDIDGDELQAGQLYYAMSQFWGAGSGGLELVSLEEQCPLYVAKARPLDDYGQPVMFFPEDKQETTVKEGNTLNVMFPQPTPCSESTVWRYDTANDYVTGGGTSSSIIGPHYSRFAVFKSENIDKVYHIRSCPCSTAGPSCRMACSPGLGVGDANGKSVLRVNANAVHGIIFAKVKKGGEEPMIRSATKLNKKY